MQSESTRTYKREWMRKRRAEYLADAVCAKCGSTEDIEIHHRDPAQKVSHRIWAWRPEQIVEELAKCDTLCARCHAQHHAALRRSPCGTHMSYRRGCRCEACKKGHADHNRRYHRATYLRRRARMAVEDESGTKAVA